MRNILKEVAQENENKAEQYIFLESHSQETENRVQ